MNSFPVWNVKEFLHPFFVEPPQHAGAESLFLCLKAEMLSSNPYVHEAELSVLDCCSDSGGELWPFTNQQDKDWRLEGETIER